MEGVGEKRRVIPRFEFKGRPLDKTESNVVLKTLMYGADCFGVDGKEVPLEKDEEIAETFYAKVFLKRIECYKLPFKVSNIFFMLSCMTWVKSPAAVMMLLRLLWQDYAENKTTYYDMNTWAEKLFPWGVPSNEEMFAWWDRQKCEAGPLGTDNMVDYKEYWALDEGRTGK